jgi:hypothetical protein
MTLAVERSVSRNDPCPCGSGRRYKDCHGSLRAGAQPTTALAPRTSAYRAPGDDWAGLDEATRDRLGAIMERALQEQLAQRVRDAERLYRSVLEQAPQTHDALHMLGVIRLGLGDFTDAEQLIRRAMALRPEYPAIATNWSLVRRAIAARDRRGVEILCEYALPLLFESLGERVAGDARPVSTASAAVRELAIVGPRRDPSGDGTWLAGRLRELLAPLGVRFWNAEPDAGDAWQPLDRYRVDVSTGRRPHGERVALVGLEGEAETWLREPIDRVLIFMQRSMPSLALERLRRIAADGARALTLVFDSHAKARRFGLRQHVLPPPLAIDEVPPRKSRESLARLRVATVGQDRLRVAVAEDGDHLCSLAECAGELRVLDPGPLRYALGASCSIACMPHDATSLAAFVASSDVFLQRPMAWWGEDPRPLLTAMALGVPALCPRASIYAEYVDDANDGWLYDDDAHAQRLVAMLRGDRSRVYEAGSRAQAKVRALLEPRTLAAAYRAVVEQWMSAP